MPAWSTVKASAAIVIGGAAVGWAHGALRVSGALRPRARDGMALGAVLWCAMATATVLGATVRLTDWRARLGGAEAVSEVIVLLAVAAFIGWRWSHRMRGAIAFAVAALALTSLTGGPFPVTTSLPALGLFLGFLPIFTFCGAVLALAAQRISRFTYATTPAEQPES
jgi:hypothetical protein